MATTTAAAPTPSDLPPLAGSRPPLLRLLRDALEPTSGSRTAVVGAAGCLVLLAVAFWSDLRHFAYTWSTDENYSHGFLVPVIALYFANEVARRGPVAVRGGVGLGSALLALALLGKLATILVPIGIVADGSLLLALAGLCALFGGTAALRRYGFAIAFLAFMVPLPIALYTAIASPLQLMVSKVAAAVLNGVGIPVLRHGNLMTLPGDVTMFVAEACSGMRQLTGFLALTTAVAYLSARPGWYRAVVVASSVPIAMTANVIRVVLTGAIMYHLDPKFAIGSYHTAEGLLMMGLGLLLLAVECTLLGRVAAPRAAAGPGPAPAAPIGRGSAAVPATRLAVGVALLAGGLGAQAAVERATETPRPLLRRPLASIPTRLGPWVGRDEPTDPDVLRESQADDHLNRVYEDPDRPGRRLTVWMNYSRLGLNLRHSPEVCLPSGGWEKVESQTRTLALERPTGPAQPMTRLAYRRGELVQEIGFWYYIFGEGRLEQFVRRLPVTGRSSHGRATRGSGLTVEIFCPGDGDPDGALLRDFAAALLAELDPLLPEPRAQYHTP